MCSSDLHSALSGQSVPELEARFAGQGYGHLKVEVADVVVAALEPVRTRALELLDDPAELDRLLARGAERARERASVVLARAFDRVGVLPAAR